MNEVANNLDKQDSLDEWIKPVSPVAGDGEYVQGDFYVRLHNNLSVDEQANLINSNIKDCTFSKFSSISNTVSENEDPTKICPGDKVFHFHTLWRRKLDECEDRKELEEEFLQKQCDIVSLLTSI